MQNCRHDRAIQQMRIERGARHLHSLGARATAAFLDELTADAPGARDRLVRKLAEWQARLTPAMVRLAGGDQFPSRLTAVPDELASTGSELSTPDQRPAGAEEAG